jgi:hypothetical protein
MIRLWLLLAIVQTVLLCIACDRRPLTESDLRGSFSPSQDGKTYLAVGDDNGGHCGSIKVDGTVWPHRISEVGPIDPGHHTIECGGKIDFDIRRGVVYRFNYRGP